MGPTTAQYSANGLQYEEAVRMVAPEQNYRRGRFKTGWTKAVDGTELDDEVLETLTWENLGWRLGVLFGDTSDDLKEELYEWCVRQQTE